LPELGGAAMAVSGNGKMNKAKTKVQVLFIDGFACEKLGGPNNLRPDGERTKARAIGRRQ
jgi:hypothetical protein